MRRGRPGKDPDTLQKFALAWGEFRGQKTLKQIAAEHGIDHGELSDWGYGLKRPRLYKQPTKKGR